MQNSTSSTTFKSLQKISVFFFKKYRKYERRIKTRNNQIESTSKNAYHSTSANAIRGRLVYEYNAKSRIFNTKSDQLWPISANRKIENHGIATGTPDKDLTALASFPVIFLRKISPFQQTTTSKQLFFSHREVEILGSDIYCNKPLEFTQEVYTKTSVY